MTKVWPYPASEKQQQAIREITTRLLMETDRTKIEEMMTQLARIVEFRLQTRQPD